MVQRYRTRALQYALVLVVIAGFGVGHAAGPDSGEDIKALKTEIEELRRRDAETRKQLDQLEKKLESIQAAPVAAPVPQPTEPPAPAQAADALDKAVDEVAAPAAAPNTDWLSRQVGPARLRLIDISFDTLVAAGTSTATDSELKSLEAGAHDPNQRGFTLQEAELSLAGAVDPYLNGEAHIVFTPSGVELEEAFMTTQSLPYGLQAKAGYYLDEFGFINPSHPHAWDWIDQPVINTRLFGGDGLRSTGVRVGWLTPLPWYSEIYAGLQNANQGETTVSFFSDEPIGGRPEVTTSTADLGDLLYFLSWKNSWNLNDEWTALADAQGLHGPNSTGPGAQTWIYGGDFKLRWRPVNNFRGWPFFLWQSEVSARDYTANAFVSDTPTEPNLPAAILRDAGFYSQALYGFHYQWAAGLRFEYASGAGKSVIDGELVSRQEDPTRGDRYRLSPILIWEPTEYSRFRLQFNYDNAKFLPGDHDAYTFWVGGEILYGAHPAHKY